MKFKMICLLFIAMTSGIYAQGAKKTVTTTTTTKKATTAPVKSTAPTTGNEGIFAEIETSKGKILLELEYVKTPITVANFISLAEGTNTFVSDAKLKGKPFYNGLKFHRVIKDFMIQGGDPLGNGSGNPGYKFKDEITDQKFEKGGVLAMANSGPGTNGSQFFITHKDTPWLNGKHTIFGHVVSGMDVVNAIAQDDVINKITIIRKGGAAKKFDAAKVFTDYYGNKAEDDKKVAAVEAEKMKKQAEEAAVAKKEYTEKYGPVITSKAAALAKLKTTAAKTDSGLEYVLIKANGKKPVDGTPVYIHYAGYLEDGTLFDSSYEEVNKAYGKFDQARADQNGYGPMKAEAGKYRFIPGFVEGLNLMSFGDKATLFIPSKLGYGERGAGGVIPPNANIIFEVELLENMPEKK